MRHNFVNDIGDYAKYALLRALCDSSPESWRLGVIWYLTEHIEHNGDGRRRPHLSGDGWEVIDPELLAKMRSIESRLSSPSDLHLDLIEQSDILPTGTVYFSEPIPSSYGSSMQRIRQREAWFTRAKESVAKCALVFLDPDNGLEVKSVRPGSRFAGKYVAVNEMTELMENGSLVILYQHGDRSPWQTQKAKVYNRLVANSKQQIYMRSLRFGAFGARAFLCVTTNPDVMHVLSAGFETLAGRVVEWDKAYTLQFE